MKNKIILLISILLLVSFSFASEGYKDSDYKEKISKTYYNSRGDYVVSRSLEAYYDNEDRHSTYDYRHGYSYRTSKEYWVDKHDYVEVEDFRIIEEGPRCLNCDKKDSDRGYIIYFDDEDERDYDRYDRYEQRRYDRYDYNRDYYYRDYDEPRIQKRYVPYLDSYDYRECYDYVPRGKLFYISCDDWLY